MDFLSRLFGPRPSSIVNQPAPVPTTLYPHEVSQHRPEWAAAAQIADKSLARIENTSFGMHLGCGVLIGIDRLLVPAHIVRGTCASKLKIRFNADDGHTCFEQSYKGARFLEVNDYLDFCILQLATATEGRYRGHYPGNHFPIPTHAAKPHAQHHVDEHLLIHVNECGAPIVSIGQPCSSWSDQEYCSTSPTTDGGSGGLYFDKQGRLLAMHQKRSTGICGASPSERFGIYIEDIIARSSVAKISQCQALCLPTTPAPCLAPQATFDPCFIDEKGRPAVNAEQETKERIRFTRIGNREGRPVTRQFIGDYWEGHPKNPKGEGPRRIRLTINELIPLKKGVSAIPRYDVTYMLSPNPHYYPAYNKNQTTLYQNAANTFFHNLFNPNVAYNSFTFEAYGITFTAIPEKVSRDWNGE